MKRAPENLVTTGSGETETDMPRIDFRSDLGQLGIPVSANPDSYGSIAEAARLRKLRETAAAVGVGGVAARKTVKNWPYSDGLVF